MKKQRDIVKELIELHRSCVERMDKLKLLGVEVDIMANDELLKIALDIIGFPEDNTEEFDFDTLNGRSPNGKRTDYNNLYCRDGLKDFPYIYYSEEDLKAEGGTIDDYLDFLYCEYNKLNSGIKPQIDLSKFKDISLN